MGIYMFLLIFIFLVLTVHEKLFGLDYNHLEILRKKERFFKKISFVFLFITLGSFSAVRDEVGIDYSSYIMHIQKINLGQPHYMEPGFKYFSRFVMNITHDPRMVLGAAAIITCYFYSLAIYRQSKDIKFSIFLFLTWGYYFFTFNTIRNYLALSIVMFAMDYLFDKKYIKFILYTILAASFHKSALICIPLYIIASKKINKNTYLIISIFSILLLLLKDNLRDIAFWFYPQYEGSIYDSGRISYLNILKSAFVLLYGGVYYKKVRQNLKLQTYFNLNFFSLVIYTCLFWLPEISRIGFYFNIVSILFIPNLTQSIMGRDKIIIKSTIYLFSVILFFLLMRNFYDPTIKLLPYNTWLF